MKNRSPERECSEPIWQANWFTRGDDGPDKVTLSEKRVSAEPILTVIPNLLERCERAGITAHQFADPDRALPYLRKLRERGSKLQFICLHADRAAIREAVDQTQPIAIVHHGGVTDRLFAEGKADLVHDYVKAAKDTGVLAGVSAHNPDCIRRVADEGWEVDFFMTCFYFLTRKLGG